MEVRDGYILELNHISKMFPGVKALDGVDLRLKQGEILALIGENGAGKSTLINCITGVYFPDEGDIRLDGRDVKLRSPQGAFAAGIRVVHQERNLIPTFDVANNIFFDKICGSPFSLVDKAKMYEEAKELLDKFGLHIKPTDNISNLSSAQKQLLEIIRALSQNARVLLLDEPTASISQKEADRLLEIVLDLKKQGVSIIYISHKLEEIFRVADRVKVIRDGKSVSEEIPIGQLNRDRLIELMVGNRNIKEVFPMREISPEIALSAKDIHSRHSKSKNTFKLHKGEILGWYGLVGAGRTELARELIGIDPVCGGELYIGGKPVKIRSYKEAFEKHRIYYLSENRREEGLFLIHSISTNVGIVALNAMKNKLGLHSYAREKKTAEQYRELLSIKMGNVQNAVSSLSGGNQQKVCIAKALLTRPEIIIIDEPTVGIDVKTKSEIYKLILDLAESGISIILISSDMAELIQVADRIQVFSGGRIVGEMDNLKDYDTMSTKIMDSIMA